MPVSLNRVINVEDFSEPTVRDAIREVFANELERHPDFPDGCEDREQWEAAMAVLALQEAGAVRSDAEILGIGVGNEALLVWLTNHVRCVRTADPVPELPHADETFDAVVAPRSIVRHGGLAEAQRVLKPGGVLSASTDVLLLGDVRQQEAERTAAPRPEQIQEILCEWEPVTPLDFSVSPATWRTETPADEARYPHVVLRAGPDVFTSFHLALRKPARPVAPQPSQPVGPIPAAGPREDVAALAQRLPDPIVVVDAGCRWGFGEQWTALHPNVRLVGFDPDEGECRRLEELYGDEVDATLVPIALGSMRERRSLHRFKFSAASSFHPHDEGALKHAAIPREGDELEELVEVEVETLDRWCSEHDVTRVDAMKLDVQGHELEILRGAAERLADVRTLELEVCLNPIMAGTPLFGEIDEFLRNQGFYLWRLRDLAHYPVKGGDGVAGSVERSEHLSYRGHQSIQWTSPPGFVSWGNAHYVRRELFDAEARLPWSVRLRDAVLMNALRFHDLAAVALRRALEAAPPEAVAVDIRAALVAATHVQPTAAPPQPQEVVAAPVEPEPATVSRPPDRPWIERGLPRLLRALAKRPYRPLVWRLERNHQHAEWRADVLGQQLGELGARMAAIEASIAALAAKPPPASPPSALEIEVRQALDELRRTHELSNEAVVEWSAVIGRALGNGQS